MTAQAAQTAHVIDGRAYADRLRKNLAADVSALTAEGGQPGLATVMAGDSYPAQAYERRVRRLAERVGVHYMHEALPAHVSEAEALAVLGKLGADPRVSGILVLRPLPAQLSEAALYRALDPLKDIEAVHPVNAGLVALGRPRFVPSTPASAFHLLDPTTGTSRLVGDLDYTSVGERHHTRTRRCRTHHRRMATTQHRIRGSHRPLPRTDSGTRRRHAPQRTRQS